MEKSQTSSKTSGALNLEADFINDSISFDLDDDSFDIDRSNVEPNKRFKSDKPISSSSSSSFPNLFSSTSRLDQRFLNSDNFRTRSNVGDQAGVDEGMAEGEEEGANDESMSEMTPRPNKKKQRQVEESNDLPSKFKWDKEVERNLKLEREKDWLERMNGMLENVADQMDGIKDKFKNVQRATETSHSLLDLYSRILTQTEHTRELISNPDWQGLTAILLNLFIIYFFKKNEGF
ncbi:DASH complex subunit Duo1-domain-containing protein [Phakopsora pachyrhizi]|nr:DASH complex subunit Duo1-domain-containing protein [Phakopsora pachyrhizi]